MAQASFPDGSYLELIAIQADAERLRKTGVAVTGPNTRTADSFRS
jgi:hypothetical protein